MHTIQARRVALDILMDIEQGAYSNIRLRQMPDSLSAADRRLVTELVYGTLETRLRLDWVLAPFIGNKRVHAAVRQILRLSAYQILFMDRIPVSAACNQAVLLVQSIGKKALSGFVNAVLRNIVRHANQIEYPDADQAPVQHLSILYSWPEWIVEALLAHYGFTQTERMLSFTPDKRTNVLRCNRLKIQPDELMRYLQREQVSCRQGAWSPEAILVQGMDNPTSHPLYRQGFFSIQGQAAMLAAHAIGPAHEWHILDVCAAPGGKSAHLSELTQGHAVIEAWDMHPHRVKLIEQTVRRLDLANITVTCQDALIDHPELFAVFDCVLLDAPCSGLGLQGRPEMRYRTSRASINALAILQRSLLDKAAQYLRPGGVLAYCTCTMIKQENKGLVDAFLAGHSDFHYDPIVLPGKVIPAGFKQFIPCEDGVEDFFVARLKRNV